MATAIPWETGGSNRAERTKEEINEMYTLYHSSVLPKLAVNAIVEEILRSRLRYVSTRTGIPNPDMTVPHAATDIVRQCVISVLQVGYFSYRFLDATTQKLPLVIGHVLQTYPVLERDGVTCAIKNMLAAETDSAGSRPGERMPEWDAVFFNKPVFASGAQYIICSRLRDARISIENIELLRRNHLRRDTYNSSHGGFATVNPGLSSMGTETWFSGRDGASDAAVRPFLSRAVDFNQIVVNRAKTIRQLGEKTRTLRAAIPERVNMDGHGKGDDVDGASREHEEHIITDGYNFHEASALQSLGNAAHHYDRLETAALFSLGVPPQALGKNINSERLASANTLTLSALRMFASFCRRILDAIAQVFRACSEVEGHYIGFSQTVKDNDLGELAPFLEVKRLRELTATVYGIPSAWISTSRLKVYQDSLIEGAGGSQTGGSRPSGEEVPPERKTDAKRSAAEHAIIDKMNKEGVPPKAKKSKKDSPK